MSLLLRAFADSLTSSIVAARKLLSACSMRPRLVSWISPAIVSTSRSGIWPRNDHAFLFLMDYAHRRRIKVWGRARVIESDPELISRLMPEHYPARPEQVILLEVKAWDTNCSQHIPQKLNPAEVTGSFAELRARIELLENDNDRLRATIRAASPKNRL